MDVQKRAEYDAKLDEIRSGRTIESTLAEAELYVEQVIEQRIASLAIRSAELSAS